VRATANGGKDQVVLLYMRTLTGGTRTCSGTLFAPRVVLTAAHCLKNVAQNQVFAYWGDDFAADLPSIDFGVPPPGSPSKFAQADSYENHPDWDPALAAPDMAVVYLDRKPPFDPMPLARFRIDHDWSARKQP